MRRIGFSTGALAFGNFKKAIELMENSSANAIELSALRRQELDPLAASINDLDLSQYSYISVHAPSRFDIDDEQQVIKQLEIFANKDWPIVVHPDAIKSFERWRVFGHLLLIENMDSRKSIGKTYNELEKIFDKLPDARFCFDIAHARQFDRTMNEAIIMLRNLRSIMTQIHISGFNDQLKKHTSISNDAITDYNRVSSLIPDDVSVILESIVGPYDIETEINSAYASLKRKQLIYATTANFLKR